MKGCLNHWRLQTQLKCSMDPSRHQGETLAWEKIGNKVQIPDLELHQWASQFCRDCGQLTSGQLLAGMARVCWGGSHISEPEWHTWLSSGLSFMTLAPRALAHSFAPHTFAHRLCAWDCAGPEQVAEGGGQRCPRKVDSLAWTRDQCSPTCRTVDLWGALVLMQKVQPGKRTSIPDWIHHTGAPYRYYSRWPRARPWSWTPGFNVSSDILAGSSLCHACFIIHVMETKTNIYARASICEAYRYLITITCMSHIFKSL